ncbi:hypothetical protein J6590_077064 [Homalodisca vitripennis]|nr:hypothetical protein J6590_077064 [Homalodisca vitripennis]
MINNKNQNRFEQTSLISRMFGVCRNCSALPLDRITLSPKSLISRMWVAHEELRKKSVMAGGEDDSKCGCCNYLVYNNDDALLCDGMCGKWFHIKCVDMTKKLYSKISELENVVVWYCKPCSSKVSSIIRKSVDVEDLLSLRIAVDKLLHIVKGVVEDNVSLNGKLDSLSLFCNDNFGKSDNGHGLTSKDPNLSDSEPFKQDDKKTSTHDSNEKSQSSISYKDALLSNKDSAAATKANVKDSFTLVCRKGRVSSAKRNEPNKLSSTIVDKSRPRPNVSNRPRSFKVCVPENKIDIALEADTWPDGVLVKMFRVPRRPVGDESFLPKTSLEKNPT